MTYTTTRPAPKTENGHGETSMGEPARPKPPAPPPMPQRRSSSGIWLMLLVLLAIGGGSWAGYYYWTTHMARQADAAASKPGAGRGTPVVAAVAQRKDVPIYVDGVGSVVPLNTVTLHTRVDGQLVKLSFKEGQEVKEGELLAVIDPQPFEQQVAQAEAQLDKDQVNLKNAQRDLVRYQTAQEAVPKQQVDTAQAQVDQLNAQIQIDEAVVKNANVQLGYTNITAPMAGRLGLRNVDLGNIVHASDPNGLAVITQMQPITVVFTLPQERLPQVQKAMREEKRVPVLAYDATFQNQLASGYLMALDNQIDVASGTFKIKAEFDNKDEALYPNLLVNVRLLAETRKEAVVVPAEAVQRSPEGSYVDIIKEDQTVEQRTVTPGPSEAGVTIIEKGVSAGETVATEGLDRLEDGTKVTILGSQTRRGRAGGAASGPETTGPASRGRGGRGATAPAASAPATGG